ncbi:hypothetical protein ACFPM0_21950 [Pseudonocardia sulfidoxydans]|uniref:hypothetical protein n=1 Tax=Pseudonocardia sulfidoxydans TaxID=54011 RepID=UPI0036177921
MSEGSDNSLISSGACRITAGLVELRAHGWSDLRWAPVGRLRLPPDGGDRHDAIRRDPEAASTEFVPPSRPPSRRDRGALMTRHSCGESHCRHAVGHLCTRARARRADPPPSTLPARCSTGPGGP